MRIYVSKIIKDAVANADNKGLNTESLKIEHATAYKSVEMDRIKPKGRAKTQNIELTNIEIVVREV